MKDKLLQFSVFVIVSLISFFAVFNIVDFTYIAIIMLLLSISIFNIKTSIIVMILARDFILKSYFYYTGHVLNISHVVLYHIVILLLILMLIFRKKKTYRFDIFNITLFILIGYLIFSTFFISSFRGYGIQKLFYFSLTLIGCLAISTVVLNPKDIKYFAVASFYQGLILVLICIVSDFDYKLFNGIYSHSRFSILGINPIWVSRLLFYGLLSNIYIFRNSRNVMIKIGIIIISIVQFYFGFLTGSRGPLLALIGGIIIYSLYSVKRISLSKVIIVLLIFTIFIAIAFNSIVNNPNSRFSGSGTGDTSTQARLLAQYQAYTIFRSNIIFGGGWGSFSQFPLEYPHNVFSEIGSETGILGLVIFLTLLIITLFRLISIYKRHNTPESKFIIAILTVSFINANLSGHIGLNPFFWLSLFLLNHYYLISDKPLEEIDIYKESKSDITFKDKTLNYAK